MKSKHYGFILFVLLISAIFSPDVLMAQAVKDSIRKNYSQKDYEDFLLRELRGEIPVAYGPVTSASRTGDALVNNNAGASGTGLFTQSETSILAYGSNVVIGFNDAGSNAGGSNKFTGWSYSSDGGVTFTDGGTLPTNAIGDAGDPVLARDETTGRIYFSTLGFTSPGTIQIFHSDDNGVTWSLPVNGTPGGSSEDKQWIAVDNFPGAGNGNVYLISRRFGAGPGIYMFRSTDQGNTFGPSGGTLIVPANQGAYVVVGPDHSVYAFWYNGTTLQMRKSTDLGVTFGPPVVVASGLTGGSNGDLALTGLRQGPGFYSSFRSNSFPHAAVNPVSGHLYVTFNDNPAGTDKGDVYMVMSSDGGATWSARVRVNDDAATTDNWQPTVAVTTTGTNIGIFYYSREGDAINNNLFTYNGRTGVISGSTVTFTPSFVISDLQSLPEFGRDAFVNSTYMGDYNSAAATATDFHVVWSDNRDDLAGGAPRKDPNVYYESIAAGLLAGPNIGVSPSAVNFGSVPVTQSETIGINITNIGDADLTISAISSPGLDFSLSTVSLPLTLPSLGSVTLDATFTPLSLGLQSSSFDITSDALNNPTVTVSLEGNGVTNIAVSPMNVDFGDVPVGTTAGPVNVVIQNIGSADLTISAISSPAPDFSLDPVVLPVVIPSLGSLNLGANFSPLASGLQNSSFDITSDAFGTPSVTVNLQGNGIVPPENDLCGNAIPLDCGTSVNGTTILATFDNAGTCGTSNTAPGVWYTLTGTGAPMTVSTCAAASYDTKLSVFSGSCEALACVGGNDDACGLRSSVTFSSVSGTTYYVLVHGFVSAVGTFTLTVSACPAEISVAPSTLTFNVPLDGLASDQLTISNTAGTGALDLTWILQSNAVGPISDQSGQPINGMTAGYENQEPNFQVTDHSLNVLRSIIPSEEIVESLSKIKNAPAVSKEDFYDKLEWVLGEELTKTYQQVIFEQSILSDEPAEKMKGEEIADGPIPPAGNSGDRELMSSGGPDGFGYLYIDSDEPGGPAFNWVDITGTGTPVVLGDDASLLVPMPFVFPFYGVAKTQVRISSNGFLTFGTAATAFTNAGIPNAANPNDIICPFWDDLNPALGGTIHYLSSATSFIVQYTDIRRFGTTQPNTFQVILNDDGSMLFQYLDMQGLVTSSTVGIENVTGTIGLSVVFNSAYVHNNLAVQIALPPPCDWITSISPSSGTIPAGASEDLTVDVDATGLPFGTYNCQITVSSNAANANQVVIPVILNVADMEPPVITVQEPITLWPPNHKYAHLDLSQLIVSILDDIDGDIPVSAAVIDSVSSDEPDNAQGDGDGNTVNDIVIASDCKAVDLRKERQGGGNGRVYKVHVSVADAAGNVGTAVCLVTVPHDQYIPAIEDAPDHVIFSNCIGVPPLQLQVMTGLDDGSGSGYELRSYPNPFDGMTTIQFTLEESNQTQLTIYNSLGIEVATLFDAVAEANQVYHLEFDAGDLPAGIYYYRLTSGNRINSINKMILMD